MPGKVFKKNQIIHCVYSDGVKYQGKFVGYVRGTNKKKAKVLFDDGEDYTAAVSKISLPPDEETKKDEVEEETITDEELQIEDGGEIEESLDEEKSTTEDDLTDATRNELKKIIKAEELGIKVFPSMSDDDVRDAIREARPEETSKVEEVEEVEEEVEEVEVEEVDEVEEKPSEKSDDVEVESWYNIGEEGSEAFRDLASREFRFWLPPGARSEITIHTDKPFIVKEHNPKIAGRYKGNYFTCLTPAGQRCPLCEAGVKAYQARAFWITDHSEYVNKAGEKVKDQTRLLVFKSKSWGIFRDTVEEHFGGKKPSFKGLRIACRRSNDDQSPGTGDIFTIKKRVKVTKARTMEEIIKEFTPLTRKELSRQVNFVQDEDEEK